MLCAHTGERGVEDNVAPMCLASSAELATTIGAEPALTLSLYCRFTMACAARVLLLLSTTSYRAEDFLDATKQVQVPLDLVVALNHRSTLEHASGGGMLTLDFERPQQTLHRVLQAHQQQPFRAVLATDDATTAAAAHIARALQLPSHAPEAIANTHNKLLMRRVLAQKNFPGPDFCTFDRDRDPRDAAALASQNPGFPCVLKPLAFSASRGVIRADNPQEFQRAFARIGTMLARAQDLPATSPQARTILVETYMPGQEVAVEALMTQGHMKRLAIFDKPDPLEGPFFEETLYITPSRHSTELQQSIDHTVAKAAAALGLTHGPIHAEIRLTPQGPRLLEIAGRSIGGLCARMLRFQAGMSLEALLLRHALGLSLETQRNNDASGVLMIPIPRAGWLCGIDTQAAREVAHITDIVVTHHRGKLVPLPEGSRYLGFVFARAPKPQQVEQALRRAHRALSFDIQEKPLP